jgi:hypothetical protein
MFLVTRDNDPEQVFVFEDPRIVEPGFLGAVIEDVSLERMDCTAEWPYGFPPSQSSKMGQDPANPKHFKMFESESVRQLGRYLKPAGKPRGPYRNWLEYLRERGRKVRGVLP